MYRYCLVLTGLLFSTISLLTFTTSIKLPERCYSLSRSLHTRPYLDDGNGGSDETIYPTSSKFKDRDDNGFELRVRRLSDGVMVGNWYEPGREYIVTLTNRFQLVGFRDALMWLSVGENKMKTFAATMQTQEGQNTNNSTPCHEDPTSQLGTWIHLIDRIPSRSNLSDLTDPGTTFTRSRYGCYGLTAERYNMGQSLATKLVVIWKAPWLKSICHGQDKKKMNRFGCVTLNGAVRLQGGHERGFARVGGLMKTLCPNYERPPSPVLPAYMMPRKNENLARGRTGARKPEKHEMENSMKISNKDTMHMDNMQPQDCCACGSATYNLTFIGLWTRETHPRDWPVHNPGLLHWTNLIGASHSPGFQLYQFGEPASAGVQAVCTYGDTTILKQSLGIAAANTGAFGGLPAGTQRGATGIGPLHSLVSAPGMWSEATLNESRSTVIGVNRTHPLISFLTMLGPSPNWCAGITGQSVCQADCTWAKRIEIDLFPWDAGVRNGDTYIPKNGDRKDIPDPIRFISRDWMPNHPFTNGLPVARVILERLLPEDPWECTDKLRNGVELFHTDGSTEVLGGAMNKHNDSHSAPVQSAMGDLSTTMLKKSRSKGGTGSSGGASGKVITTGLGGDNPLSDPSLAQMATFLCITDQWSPWSQCSVTCGVGQRTRRRVMVVNKKNELCQHVPLTEEEPCEGRKRTCDFSAPCSLLPWTAWTPCNATCSNREGIQTRRRYLARPSEREECKHLFKLPEELSSGMTLEIRSCGPTDLDCDPVTICGEGRKDGLPCGQKTNAYYYSAVEHSCLAFEYLGCKGGRNRFKTKDECENFCLPAVEALPGWRRERMALLQYKSSQIASDGKKSEENKILQPAAHCSDPMDSGEDCEDGSVYADVRWYFCPRTRRCREFVYLGCGGNKNRYENFTACLADCLPEELEKSRQMAKARQATMKSSKSTNPDQINSDQINSPDRPSDEDLVSLAEVQKLDEKWGPKRDCKLTSWSGWSPCSTDSSWETGTQMRWRHIERPARHGGQPCGMLFESRKCLGSRY